MEEQIYWKYFFRTVGHELGTCTVPPSNELQEVLFLFIFCGNAALTMFLLFQCVRGMVQFESKDL